MAYLTYDGELAADTPAPLSTQWGNSTGGQVLIGGSGADGLAAEGPNDLLIGNGGGDTFYIQSSGAQVQEVASGINQLVSYQSTSLLNYANIENLQIGGSNDYGAGDGGNNIIIATGSNQQLYGGGGHDVLVGDGQSDTFIVVKGAGDDAIYGFNPATDVVRLSAGWTSFAQVQQHMSQTGADVSIDFGDGTGAVLRNTNLSQLTASNFQLQLDKSLLGAVTFHDEFDNLSLWNGSTGTWATTFWYQDTAGNGGTLASNNEQEWYINSNYAPTASVTPWTVANGNLTITAAPASAAIQPEINGYKYTSGEVNTFHSFAQTYGYFEMRAELPHDTGGWPAFWLMPTDGSWPPELDVMETLTKDGNGDYVTSHSGVGGGSMSQGFAFVPPTEDGYHTYGVLWTKTTLAWFVDGVEVYQTATPADMNKPMYMIANLALGGWGGTVDDSQLPAQMNIDYVRAYALADGSSTVALDTANTGGATDLVTPASTPATPSNVDTSILPTAPATGDPNASAPQLITSPAVDSVLTGGSGNDTLIASQGGDTMTGGAGADLFTLKTEPWAPVEITDFQVGTDHIDLSALLKASGYTGTDPVADHYIYLASDGAGGTLIRYDDDGSGPNPAYPNTVIDLANVSPTSLTWAQLAPPPPAAPTGLADTAIAGGYVNAARNLATQALTGTALAGATITVYDGATKLGTTTADPTTGAWSFTLGKLADGAHSLTATATDPYLDVSTASAPLSFTVDTQPPAAPAALADAAIAKSYVNAQANTAAQALTGTAVAGATVTVYDGATRLGAVTASATTGAWSYTLGKLADGAHSLTATASDAAGNASAASTPLAFTVDTQAPAAPTALADAAIATGYVNAAGDTATQALTGKAEAGATVTVYDGATRLGATTANPTTGAWSFTLGKLSDGAHSLTATAADVAGNVGAASGALAFTVDTQPPAAPTALADAAISKGYVNAAADLATQTLTGKAAAGAAITIYDGVTKLGTATAGATGAWSFTLGHLTDGAHSVTATATDTIGNISAASTALAFTVDTVAPVPAVSNAILGNTGVTTLSGVSAAGSVVSVYDNGTLLGSVTANSAGVWSGQVKFGSGTHSFTEKATDPAGNPGASTGVALYNMAGNAALTGGAGDDVLMGRAGDTLTGGAGHDRFVFDQRLGLQTIADFSPTADVIAIDHTIFANFASVMQHATQSGASVLITLDRTDVLTLKNTTLASLTTGDFVFL